MDKKLTCYLTTAEAVDDWEKVKQHFGSDRSDSYIVKALVTHYARQLPLVGDQEAGEAGEGLELFGIREVLQKLLEDQERIMQDISLMKAAWLKSAE